jgi:hypothetical protein
LTDFVLTSPMLLAWAIVKVSSSTSSTARIFGEERSMTVEEEASAKLDLQEVYRLLAEGKPVTDAGLIRRIRERSEAARRTVFERNGLLDVAVPFIRALREGEDE